jgi:hypothetical protein
MVRCQTIIWNYTYGYLLFIVPVRIVNSVCVLTGIGDSSYGNL